MPNPIFKLFGSEPVVSEATRQVEVICSTATPDRIGDVVVQEGIDLTAYRTNPVVLWGHKSDKPVARAAQINVQNGQLRATVQFPPEGEDADADWTYGKIKNRLCNAVSIGFIPRAEGDSPGWEPIDPKEPWGAWRFTTTELLEFSFCSVPMNSEALVVGRSMYPPRMQRDLIPPSRLIEVVEEASQPSVADVLGAIHASQLAVKAAEAAMALLPSTPAEPQEPEVRSLADVEGRSDATRYPRRAAREVELMKLLAA